MINKSNFPIHSPLYGENGYNLNCIIIGVLFGDASLQTYTNGHTWRLRFLQSDIHKDYLFHLYDIFKPYVSSPPKFSDDGLGNKRWSFNTRVIPELNYFAALFYKKVGKNWIKVINPLILEQFTDISLTYWYMEDGSLKKENKTKAFIFCTDTFTKEEVKLLGRMFMERYKIHVGYHLKDGKYRIYIPTKHYQELKGIMEPRIHESMKYKLG